MHCKNIDLITAISIAALNVLWTQIPNRPSLVGIFFALPLIFILPGYTLTQVLLRKRPPRPHDSYDPIAQPGAHIGQPVGGADKIALSLGLSLTVDVLVGFTLNLFPIGLQALSWTLSLGLFTTIFALLTAFLRRGDITQVTRIPRLRITTYDGILFGLAILVAAIAIWFAIIRPLEPQPSFTQFWMLPENQASKSCAVSLGVQNFESTPVTYQVVMTSNGSQVSAWSSITLAPHEAWVRSVPVTPGTASSLYIEARLYREDKPTSVYRNVHMTFYIAARSSNGRIQQQCAL
jgi:uncharacterized membrane protein